MVTRERRWPDLETSLEQIKRGIIDDTTDAVPPYDLEDWEIRGEPAPDEADAAPRERSAPWTEERRRA